MQMFGFRINRQDQSPGTYVLMREYDTIAGVSRGISEVLEDAEPILVAMCKYATCQMTALEKVDIEKVKAWLKEVEPDASAEMPEWMQGYPITAMAFTVNPNLCWHQDKGDATLTVVAAFDLNGECGGGEFVFPSVGAAVEMYDGALI
eukprot:1067489-Prorocentrum_minimum.AAC.1